MHFTSEIFVIFDAQSNALELFLKCTNATVVFCNRFLDGQDKTMNKQCNALKHK